MELTPVRGYKGANYPTAAEYLARRHAGHLALTVALAAALTALAALLQGCTIGS